MARRRLAAAFDFPRMVRIHINSVWALELLLLLRSDPERRWTAKELSDDMRATVRLVETSLKHFRRLGLVAVDETGRFRFAPVSPRLLAFCEQLAAEFAARPVAVITLIAAPEARIQELADAFLFRHGKPQ